MKVDKDIRIMVYVHVQDWTMPTVKDLLFNLSHNKVIDIADIYICADRYDMNCKGIEDLKQTIEKRIPLREGVVLELDFYNDLTTVASEELKEMMQEHSGYLYFTNNQLIDVPLDLRDKISVIGIKRVYRSFFKPYSEI